MRWLLFLSRLAFICCLFFLLSLSLLFENWIKDESLVSTIITIGFFMGMIIVPITLLSYLVLWLMRKKPALIVPKWLIIANIFVLFMLAGYIIYANYLHSQAEL
jgi:glucan phosphoethanolaminetransferase (alkaline phosphatase superfamily)